MFKKTLFTNYWSVVIPLVHPNNSFIFHEIIMQVSQLCPDVTSESDILSMMYNTTIIAMILARYNPYIKIKKLTLCVLQIPDWLALQSQRAAL